jgi:chromosome segregation ATPase
MQTELHRLMARIVSAEERTRACEEEAAEATNTARTCQAELLAAQAAAKAAQATSIELRERVEASMREQQRFVSDVESRVRGVRDALRDLQGQVAGTLAPSLAAAQGTLDRTCKDVAALAGQLGEVRGAVGSLRQQSGEAETALAKDVAMLADTLTHLRASSAAESGALSSRIAAVAAAGEEARRAEAEERDRRIAAVGAELEAKAQATRRAAEDAGSAAQRAKEDAETAARGLSSDVRAVLAQVSGLEAAMSSRLQDTQRRVDDVQRSHAGRLDAMSSALHAFANVLQLGQVVVDPKAALSRSMAAAGVVPATFGSSSFAAPHAGPSAGASEGSGGSGGFVNLLASFSSPRRSGAAADGGFSGQQGSAAEHPLQSGSRQQQQQHQPTGSGIVSPVYGSVPASVPLASSSAGAGRSRSSMLASSYAPQPLQSQPMHATGSAAGGPLSGSLRAWPHSGAGALPPAWSPAGAPASAGW